MIWFLWVKVAKVKVIKYKGVGKMNLATPIKHGVILFLLLMEEILHQLRLVDQPIIYKVSYITGCFGFLPSTVVNA